MGEIAKAIAAALTTAIGVGVVTLSGILGVDIAVDQAMLSTAVLTVVTAFFTWFVPNSGAK